MNYASVKTFLKNIKKFISSESQLLTGMIN